MRVYSWNMLYTNARQDGALAFIMKETWDVFCLQEVPGDFLERLKVLPFHYAIELEAERLLERTVPSYVVILSRHPIARQERIRFPDYQSIRPARTGIFIKLMRPLQFCEIVNRGSLFVDIEAEHRTIRVFNLHLILAAPRWRREEFELAMRHRDPRIPTIICGDFNILESWHITLFNWLLGGTFCDAIHWREERISMERRFALMDLSNPLSGFRTHIISNSQLDHILLSRDIQIESAKVFNESFGSDHNPICVEIDV